MPKTEIPPPSLGTEAWPPDAEIAPYESEINLLPPQSLNYPWWRTLARSLRDRIAPEKLPPLEVTSDPVDLGMLPGDILTLPWYRTVFTNLGNVIAPETQAPLELESRPVDVGELIADRMSHPWWSSLLASLRDVVRPQRLPQLEITSKPVDPGLPSDKLLQLPRWSSVIEGPKVFLPDQLQSAGGRAGLATGAGPFKPITVDVDFTHLMVSQLKDDLTRSRLREAFWMSVVAHLLVAIMLVAAPKYLPGYRKGVALISTADLLKSRQLTYLEMPPDLEKSVPKPNTNVLSDKNRIAQSRHPTLDRKTLQELRDAHRPGAAGAPAMAAPPSRPQPAQPPQAGQMAQASPPAGGSPPATAPNQTAQLQTPPAARGSAGPSPFQQALSPGAAIQQATRAAAASRGVFSGPGAGGDYGLGTGARGRVQSNMEVLSDTMGVDFGPYLNRVVETVRLNWYNLIPEVARPPLLKKGKVSIEFAILKNGGVAGMRIVGPSGDIALDRAAYGGITASNPFNPLPTEFKGSYLALRFNFFYNPDKRDLE